MRKILLFTLSVLFLASCQSAVQVEPTPEKEQATSTIAPIETEMEPSKAVDSVPVPTIPPEMVFPERKPPEEWQEWSITPEITKRAFEIYREGIALGSDPRAFSKVGDCQNIRDAFLGKYDNLTRYPLETENEYLLETIKNFAGSFDTDGQAVRGGFNAATVLSPLRADPEACSPGESPLACELRITKPSFVFISFEVWWEGRTVESYEKYMRQIIETVIAHHAVPILATKADNIEGDHSINLATARLAAEYDIPLWNFWLAVQDLPAHGMDMERNDGFHTSYEAWDVRSLTALQTLDYLWKNLREETVVAVSESETPEVEIEIATPENLNWDYANNILFDLRCFESNAEYPQGIYRLNPTNGEVVPLLLGEYLLESVSPNGDFLLLSSGSHLFLAERENGQLSEISNAFYQYAKNATAWISDERFVALIEQEQAVDLVFFSSDGVITETWKIAEGTPTEVYAGRGGVYWDVENCPPALDCRFVGTWGRDTDQASAWQLDRAENLPFDTSETNLAYPILAADGFHNLIFASAEGEIIREYPLPQGRVRDLAWSPDGESIALTLYVQSSYSGRILKIRNFVIEMKNWGLLEYPETFGIAPALVWSPNGENLLWMGTEEIAETEFRLVATSLRDSEGLDFAALNITSPVPLILHQAVWIR